MKLWKATVQPPCFVLSLIGHPFRLLRIFFSEPEKELFEGNNLSHFHQENFSLEERKALGNLA